MENNKILKEKSGNITSDDKLVSFLYELMRDKITPGVVETLVNNSQQTPVEFTNGYLANYAKYLAERLK